SDLEFGLQRVAECSRMDRLDGAVGWRRFYRFFLQFNGLVEVVDIYFRHLRYKSRLRWTTWTGLSSGVRSAALCFILMARLMSSFNSVVLASNRAWGALPSEVRWTA